MNLINNNTALANAASTLDELDGTHSYTEVIAKSLVSIANSLLVIAQQTMKQEEVE